MKPAEYEQWKLVRTKGQFKYIAIRGILGFGLPMMLFQLIVFELYANDLFTIYMLVHVTISLLGGLFFGVMMWAINESTFKRQTVINSNT